MKNLARITNYLNKQSAWKDWLALTKIAIRVSMISSVRKFQPADDSSWRKIDKAFDALFAELKTAGAFITDQ